MQTNTHAVPSPNRQAIIATDMAVRKRFLFIFFWDI
jgi:hypothetical protein